jgi:hypothetical protein
VALNGGDAVFSGGYLRCKLDLAAVVKQNHGLTIEATDSYGSMLFATTLQSTVPVVAPIFTHPDAAYTIDFTQSSAVTLAQSLNNTAGLQQAHFPGVIGASWNKYVFEYGCAWLGACGGDLSALPFTQATPPGGKRISFATGPTTFLIGGDGVTTFQGRMGHLLIDPGNSVH